VIPQCVFIDFTQTRILATGQPKDEQLTYERNSSHSVRSVRCCTYLRGLTGLTQPVQHRLRSTKTANQSGVIVLLD